jgi:uncharacterized membrane protein
LAPLALGPLTLHRYDLWPTALTATALAALLAGRARLGFAALGLGTAAKLFPAVLLPLAFLFVRARVGARAAWAGLAAFVGSVAIVTLPFAALGPGGVRLSIDRQTGRALQLETLGSSLLLGLHELGWSSARVTFGDGSWNLVGRTADTLATVQTVVQIAAVAAVWALFARGARGPTELVLACATALAVWVALGKVLSPQFLLWLLPVVALVAVVRGLWIPLGLVAAFGLTQLVYPARYDELVALESGPVALLLARNALLVALAAALFLALQRQRVSKEVGGEREREHAGESVLLDGRERNGPDRVPGLEPGRGDE